MKPKSIEDLVDSLIVSALGLIADTSELKSPPKVVAWAGKPVREFVQGLPGSGNSSADAFHLSQSAVAEHNLRNRQQH